MKKRNSIASIGAALACLSGAAEAADVYGGSGIGFSNNPSQFVANIVFNKTDVKNGASPVVIKTGDDVTPARQKGLGTTITIPATKSMAWCDPVSNPDIPSNTDINTCYGWGMFSKWVVLDLNALQKAGLTSVWVSVTAKRYDDGVATEVDATGKTLPSDDDLVPALTVYQGRQDAGIHNHWYPNKFQKNPFWAWKLTPFAGGTTKSNGWATAYMASGSLDNANVTGRLKLKPGGQNYLTVAVGGDARHADTKLKHDVNFELNVRISKKALGTSGGANGGGSSANGTLDKCGCQIGVTQWHASMNHCMAISLCEPIAGTADQCKTPEMCAKDGGR
jgi:hypothetical protein